MQRVDYVIMAAAAFLLVIGGVLFLPTGPSATLIDSGYNDGCTTLKNQYSCDQYAVTKITAFTTTRKVSYTLGNICATKGFNNTLACARSCGCQVSGAGIDVSATPRVVYSDNPVLDGVVGDPTAEEDNTTEPTGDSYYGV